MIECPIPCNLCGASDVDVIGDRDRDGASVAHDDLPTLRAGVVEPAGQGEDEVRRYYSSEYRLHYKGAQPPRCATSRDRAAAR